MTVYRGLQCLLPQAFPPLVVRHISEFAGLSTRLCSVIRLSLHGVLHDVYCVYEDPHEILVVTQAGITLRVRNEDVGALQRPLEYDTNPHLYQRLTVAWLRAVLEPRDVSSFEVFAGAEPKSYTRTVHRRIRCYREGESAEKPVFTPFLVYMKLFAPYLVLRGVARDASVYMLEGEVVNTLMPLIQPCPAPVSFYYSVHEETGSCCSASLDVTSKVLPPQSTAPGGAFAQRLMASLAMVHGRFLAERTVASPGSVPIATDNDEPSEKERQLRASLVHPMIYFAKWKATLDLHVDTKFEDETAKEAAAEMAKATGKPFLYAPPLPAAEDANKFGIFFPEEALRSIYGCPLPALVVEAGSISGFVNSPTSAEGDVTTASQLCDRASTFPLWTCTKESSLTLIHGSLHLLEHALLTRDPRQVPSCFLVDWKGSGIGPLEVDLVDVFLTFLTPDERNSKDVLLRLLDEYCECLAIFHHVTRDPKSILKNCCDVARLRSFSKCRGEGFPWGAVKKREMILFANVLSSMLV